MITRFEKFVNSNFPTLFDRGKGGKMRNRIKARLAELGLRSQDLIKELREIGINCTPPQFSRAINGVLYDPKSELICEKADEILTQIEKEKGVK